MRNALSVLLLLLACGLASAEQPVYIPDPSLKAVIEGHLEVSDPTPTDMLSLISLEIQAADIRELTGLEYAMNLQSLHMRFNHLKSVAPLRGLMNLTALVLPDNDVKDLSPLGGLTNLTVLDIHNNQITDLAPLANLVNLWFLAIRENPLSDLSPLSKLPRLAELSLLETQVSDISPLATMTTLRNIDLRGCPLNNEAYAIYIPQIRANNPGVQIDVNEWGDRMLRLSSTFGGSVVEPGEGEHVYSFQSFVHVVAAAEPGFMFHRWTGPFRVTTNPADICIVSDYEFQAHFLSPRDVLYVNDDAAFKLDQDGSPEHPISRIQDAIDVAGDGATIFVAPGCYRQNIKISKKVHITAADPRRPNGGPCAIIEGTGGHPVVTIDPSAGSDCSLSGFVITRGRSNVTGAIYCYGASPTLSHCLIVGNRSTETGGAAVCFEQSRAVMTHCTIVDNCAGKNGAGLVLDDSDITVKDSIFWDNYPSEICLHGTSSPSITYCDVSGGWLGAGNIDSNPLLARPGYWADPADPSVWLGKQDSRAVWVDGDYHLKSQAGRWDPAAGSWRRDDLTSPAIDAGDPASPVEYEPVPNGGIVNMGAYGGTIEASLSR